MSFAYLLPSMKFQKGLSNVSCLAQTHALGFFFSPPQGWAIWNNLQSLSLSLPYFIFHAVTRTEVLQLPFTIKDQLDIWIQHRFPTPRTRISDSEVRIWISVRFPDEATAATPGPHFKKHYTRVIVLKQIGAFVHWVKPFHVYRIKQGPTTEQGTQACQLF